MTSSIVQFHKYVSIRFIMSHLLQITSQIQASDNSTWLLEILDVPTENRDFPESYISLPEGINLG